MLSPIFHRFRSAPIPVALRGVSSSASALRALRGLRMVGSPEKRLVSPSALDTLNSISSSLEGQQRAGWAWESPWNAPGLAECIVSLVELGGVDSLGVGVDPPPSLLLHPVRRCLRLLTQALSPRLPEVPLPLLLRAVVALSAAGVVYAPLLKSLAGWLVAVGTRGGGDSEQIRWGLGTREIRAFSAICDPQDLWMALARKQQGIPALTPQGGLDAVPPHVLASTLQLFSTSGVAHPVEFAPFYTLLLSQFSVHPTSLLIDKSPDNTIKYNLDDAVSPPATTTATHNNNSTTNFFPPHVIEYDFSWHREALKEGSEVPSLPAWISGGGNSRVSPSPQWSPPPQSSHSIGGYFRHLSSATSSGSRLMGDFPPQIQSPSLLLQPLAAGLLALHSYRRHTHSCVLKNASDNNAPSTAVEMDPPLYLYPLIKKVATDVLLPCILHSCNSSANFPPHQPQQQQQQQQQQDPSGFRLLLNHIPAILRCLDAFFPEAAISGEGKEAWERLVDWTVEEVIKQESTQAIKGVGKRNQICYNCYGFGHAQASCPYPVRGRIWGPGVPSWVGGAKDTPGGGGSFTTTQTTPYSLTYNIGSSNHLGEGFTRPTPPPSSYAAPAAGSPTEGAVTIHPMVPHLSALLDNLSTKVFDVGSGENFTHDSTVSLIPKVRLLTLLSSPFLETALDHDAASTTLARARLSLLFSYQASCPGEVPPAPLFWGMLKNIQRALLAKRSLPGGLGEKKTACASIFSLKDDGGGGDGEEGGALAKMSYLKILWVLAGSGNWRGAPASTTASSSFACETSKPAYASNSENSPVEAVGGGSARERYKRKLGLLLPPFSTLSETDEKSSMNVPPSPDSTSQGFGAIPCHRATLISHLLEDALSSLDLMGVAVENGEKSVVVGPTGKVVCLAQAHTPALASLVISSMRGGVHELDMGLDAPIFKVFSALLSACEGWGASPPLRSLTDKGLQLLCISTATAAATMAAAAAVCGSPQISPALALLPHLRNEMASRGWGEQTPREKNPSGVTPQEQEWAYRCSMDVESFLQGVVATASTSKGGAGGGSALSQKLLSAAPHHDSFLLSSPPPPPQRWPWPCKMLVYFLSNCRSGVVWIMMRRRMMMTAPLPPVNVSRWMAAVSKRLSSRNRPP